MLLLQCCGHRSLVIPDLPPILRSNTLSVTVLGLRRPRLESSHVLTHVLMAAVVARSCTSMSATSASAQTSAA
jgi:hypothetical protein